MTINNKLKFINTIINGFQNYKGKASCYCYNNDVITELVYSIVNKYRNKTPENTILIVTENYNQRIEIRNILITNQCYHNIHILTSNFVNEKNKYNYSFCIIIGVNDNINKIISLVDNSKFTLLILTKNIMNNDFITSVRTILPDINTNGLANAISTNRISHPVEERRIRVAIPDYIKIKYDEYTKYINNAISIFGNIDNIIKCRKGDTNTNKSATEYCNYIAKENGWNMNLDTNIEFMKEIDDLYNPIQIAEKAEYFFNISRERRNLVFNNEFKLSHIKEICDKHKDDKVIIVSKSDEFASAITSYINSFAESPNNPICLNYHDKLDKIPAVNDNGEPIKIKSGINKGDIKWIGAAAQNTLAEKRFNDGRINVLSIKETSSNKLKCTCTVVIFTSSMCNNITQIRERFTNITFNGTPLITYKLYTENTIEENNIDKNIAKGITSIVTEENNEIIFDKDTNAVVI